MALKKYTNFKGDKQITIHKEKLWLKLTNSES